jgi:predicted RNA-binding Zn-ribbon protein involved in translation (DUF1610 family)
MAKDYQEREFDDEVYEDGYYEDNYEEEELEEDEIEKPRKTVKKAKKSLIESDFDEDEEKIKDEDDDEDEEDEDEDKDDSWEKERKINVSYACEDCDYRWDDIIIKKSEFDNEEDMFDTTCPMCGSMSITQI